MENKKNLPYIPLYTGDWEKDCNVLSLSAEAAWLRIIFKMFNNGKQSTYKVSTKALQNLWRVPEELVISIIEELEDNNICGIERTEKYVLFTSRRYEKENIISDVRRKAVSQRKDRTNSLQKSYKKDTNTLHNTENENEYEYNNNKGIVLENLTPVDEAIGPELSECKKIVESDQIWVEAFCMNNRITIPQFKTFLTDFFKKLQDEGETRRTPKDAKRHFANWVKIQNKASNGTEQPKKTYRRFSDTATPQR